jgi:ribonuclease J
LGEVADEVLRDRRHIAADGLLVPVLAIGQTGAVEFEPELITRGFVVDPKTEDLLREVPGLLRDTIETARIDERTDPGLMKEKIRVELQRFIRKRVGRRPLVLPVIMEI